MMPLKAVKYTYLYHKTQNYVSLNIFQPNNNKNSKYNQKIKIITIQTNI